MKRVEYQALNDGRDHLRRAVSALNVVGGLYVDLSTIDRLEAMCSVLAQMIERAKIDDEWGSK